MVTSTPIRTTPSAEILRACEVLRTLLLLAETDERYNLVGTVSTAIDEIQERLCSLSGLQKMFEQFTRS